MSLYGLATETGIEPVPWGSKPHVLPLHHSAISVGAFLSQNIEKRYF